MTQAVRELSPPSAATDVAADAYELIIQPRRGWIAVNWREMLHYRELLYFLIWRDVKVRYKQTVLGVAWAVLQPLFSMVVFTVIFGNFAGMDERLPPGWQDKYAIFVYAGLLPWMFFSTAITTGGLSLVNSQNLLTKVYFPRLFVPAATLGGALVDLAISMGVFAVLMVIYRTVPSPGIVALPPLIVLTVLASMGIASTLSALTVTYRDFRFVVPFLVQAWMFVSPVVYPVNIVPERYQWLLALNPMMGIIDGFRAAILGLPWRPLNLAISTAVTIALLLFGMYYFRKTERRFADIA